MNSYQIEYIRKGAEGIRKSAQAILDAISARAESAKSKDMLEEKTYDLAALEYLHDRTAEIESRMSDVGSVVASLLKAEADKAKPKKV